MPSRVIRGDINSSRSLARVSRDARLTFRALLNVVDDFGRFDGRISLLRSLLYPVDPDVTDEMVNGWLGELTVERPIPPVAFYAVDGVEYLHLPGWEKHKGNQRRRKASIYPDPPVGAETPGNHCPGGDGHLQEMTAGVGVGVGVGLGEGVGEGVQPAASPPLPDSHSGEDPPISAQANNPEGQSVNTRIDEDRPRATNVSAEDAGVQKRDRRTTVDAGGPVAPASRRKAARKSKRAVPCPEILTTEQWNQVFAWRDRERPEFTNAELRAQWTLHYRHHAHKGNTGLKWVLSFYNWLTGPYYKPAVSGDSQPPRPQPPAYKPGPPPTPLGPDELAEVTEIGDERRKKRRRFGRGDDVSEQGEG